MRWEHLHQAHTEITKSGCPELSCRLNIHRIVYVSPLFLLSRTERFYSVCAAQLIQDGFCVLIYHRDDPSPPWPHCWNLFPSQVYSKCSRAAFFSLTSSTVTSVNTGYCWRQADFCVCFYSKGFPRDVGCVLFIALPSFSSPSCSHLLLFHSSLISSLLDCDLGHPLSKKRIQDWNIFRL